jgi:hypothetical protein
MEENRNVLRALVQKPTGKRPLRKPRRRWRIILKIVNEIKWKDIIRMNLA